MATVYQTIQLKRGKAAAWIKNNPVLAAGEAGFELDTNKLKIGDGSTPWSSLPYQSDNSVINASTHYDFPSVGRVDVIYKAAQEQKLYQWNPDTLAYESLNLGGVDGTLDIDYIYGGNAYGNA